MSKVLVRLLMILILIGIIPGLLVATRSHSKPTSNLITQKIVPLPSELPEFGIAHIDDAINVVDLVPATRVEPPLPPTTLPAPTIPLGLWGQPFAPEGLSDCDEFNFYRAQWGLPERFNKLAWRESNCLNQDDVKTYCCHGYLQLYISLQIKDQRVMGRYHECGVYSSNDVNSDNPLEKQKHLCAAGVLYSIVGYSAWSTS